jgi:hypothetical protein
MAVIALALGIVSLAAPRLTAQYSVTKYIDPTTFPTDTNSLFTFGQPIATDGTYTAISTFDAVWSEPVAGGTPQKLFSVGTNLPSSTTPATFIYGAVFVSNGTVVFSAAGTTSGSSAPTLYGIYSVPANGSSGAVRVADSTQVSTAYYWEQLSDTNGQYGVFAVAGGTVVFSINAGIYSATTDGSNLTTLWLEPNGDFVGCSTAGQEDEIFHVTGTIDPATNGTDFTFTGYSILEFVALYEEPLGTVDGCNDLITSGQTNLGPPVNTLPGQPQAGNAFAFDGILQIDGDYVYFQADAGQGVSSTEDYYGIFKVPLAGGAASVVANNLSQLPLLETAPGVYDEPSFNGYAVKNGKVVFYAGDATQGGTGEPAFYMVQGDNFVPVFTDQTSVNNQCTGNMTGSNVAGLNQVALTSDGLLYFPAEYVTTGPDLNGSCAYSFLRFQPFAYYVVDTTHPLIPAQTTISFTPSTGITTTTPVTINIAVAAATGASNPSSLVPTGTVTVYFSSPQFFGVQQPAQTTINSEGKATIALGDLEPALYTFTVAYGGDSNFTSSGSNAVTFDTRTKPTITWPTPAPITYGTALSGTQLDATATVAGSTLAGAFVYTPAAGTVPPSGVNTLSVTFTPSNTNDYQTVTATVQLTVIGPATMTSPTAGSTLTGPSVTFNWTNTGATQYYLSVGSTGVGSTNVYNSGWRTVTSWTATGLPTNSETLYVRLSTDYSGTVVHNDYTYTAYAPPPAAVLTSPTAGSILTGVSVPFTWTSETGATQYYLSVGSTGVGSTNVYNSGWRTVTTWPADPLPTNGETLYVRLSTDYSGTVVHNDYTYTASTQAAVTSPTANSILTGPSVTFNWSAATGATQYYLSVGSTGVGSTNVYNSGGRDVTSWTATGLPANGETVYVRLSTDYNGLLAHSDTTYTAATAAVLTTPTPETTLSGSSVMFTWLPGTTGATQYYISVGSTGVGSSNIYNSGWRDVTSWTATGLPTNGETVYVRLSTDFGGTTVHNDYTYTAH